MILKETSRNSKGGWIIDYSMQFGSSVDVGLFVLAACLVAAISCALPAFVVAAPVPCGPALFALLWLHPGCFQTWNLDGESVFMYFHGNVRVSGCWCCKQQQHRQPRCACSASSLSTRHLQHQRASMSSVSSDSARQRHWQLRCISLVSALFLGICSTSVQVCPLQVRTAWSSCIGSRALLQVS